MYAFIHTFKVYLTETYSSSLHVGHESGQTPQIAVRGHLSEGRNCLPFRRGETSLPVLAMRKNGMRRWGEIGIGALNKVVEIEVHAFTAHTTPVDGVFVFVTASKIQIGAFGQI